MEIRINGEKLDVQLEGEENAHDVLEGIMREMKTSEMVVSGLFIDDKEYTLEDDALKNIPIDNVKIMDIEVSSRDEVMATLLRESKVILQKISADLKAHGYAHVKEFTELLNWISETIETINQLSAFNMVESKLLVSAISQVLAYLNGNEKEEKKIESLSTIIESLIHYLEAIELKITTNFSVNPDELREAIGDCVALLPEISEAFQLGKDREAFEKINTVISVLEMCCIYLKKNIGTFSVSTKDEIDCLYEEINNLLTQIVGAFENGDVVLLGDLLEYEMPEKLENYKNLVLSIE